MTFDYQIEGETGNDWLVGNAGEDALDGGSGNDSLSGGAGDDTLCGGSGDDTLYGGLGSDTYRLAAGDGLDRVEEYESGAGEFDRVVFEGVNLAEVTTIERRGNDLQLQYTASDRLTVKGYFGSTASRIEAFDFADQTLDEAGLKGRVMTLGDAAANTIYGYADGSNRIFGQDGNDSLYGGAWGDRIEGEAGNDRLTGNAGDDVLWGGSGNDSLNGGAGNDRYHFAAGDGLDRIDEYDTSTDQTDRVEFGGVNLADVTTIERRGNDLLLQYTAGDRLTVGGYFTHTTYRVEQFVFADQSLDEAGIKARVVTLGDAAGNYISGYNDGSNRIFGQDGNDTLYGGAWGDRVDGGAGNDRLTGYAGDDVLDGGSDNDSLWGGEGHDALAGGEGNDALTGDAGSNLLLGGTGLDTLTGGAGHEWLAGGTGDDLLQTGTGRDVLLFNRGDGIDTVRSAGTGADNTLSLGGGLVAGDLALRREGSTLVLDLGQGDALRWDNWYDSPSNHSLVNLQMISAAAEMFDVERYDFAGLVARFDTETPGVTPWALNEALLDFHLAGNDDTALGGDVAIAYALGRLPGMGLDAFAQAAAGMADQTGPLPLQPWREAAPEGRLFG